MFNTGVVYDIELKLELENTNSQLVSRAVKYVKFHIDFKALGSVLPVSRKPSKYFKCSNTAYILARHSRSVFRIHTQRR